jgi:NhaA family Na+:H+ antiporter
VVEVPGSLVGDTSTTHEQEPTSRVEHAPNPDHRSRRPPPDAQAAGAAVLLAAAVVALLWANSPWADSYRRIWATQLSLGARLDLRHWVNDGLMAVFFFVVGLEIKREVAAGPLRDRRTAALPVVAAAGGMVAPALVYLALTAGTGAGHGWAIPMATDIAFAVGVLALVGPVVPRPLALFVLTLAVVDDIGAILVIAVFYASGIRPVYLLASLAVVVAVVALRRLGVAWLPAYVALGITLWFALRASGVHPTIAGVALGLLTPVTPRAPHGRLEDRLRPWTTFAVLPVFAVANAGVQIRADVLRVPGATAVFAGVAVGLAAGKVLGITGAARLAAGSGLATRPAGASWAMVASAATVAGIGFTVSLFIAELAFPSGAVQDAAKLGVFAGSLVAGGVGALALRITGRRP